MLDPCAESLSSTGEPPTVSPDIRRNNLSSSSNVPDTSQLSMSNGSSRSLSVQELDSGYEASPSSVVGNQRFFSEQSAVVETTPSNVDEEFDIVECHSQILFTESESDELEDYHTCHDCCSSRISCNCYRTDSSNTYATALSNCDSMDLSFYRPSSQPIEIPILPSCRFRSNARIEIFGTLGEIYTRSQPLDFRPLNRLGLIPQRLHPLSWPFTAVSPLRSRRNIALPSPRNTIYQHIRDIPNSERARYNHPVRSRRQMIDSEDSSFCSSDDEGPEDVFNMPTEASSYPAMTVVSGPLPDVVLESTDSGRRSRSLSVNLPPGRERAIQIIAQNLRRMSDLFEQRQQFSVAVRRRTTSDCHELRRNGVP